MATIGNNTHKKLTLDGSKKDTTPKWVVPFLAGGWILGFLALYLLFNVTDISFWETLKYLLLFSVIFTLVPYKWVVKIAPIDYQFVIIINFLALGPICTSLFFLGNLLLASNPQNEIVPITHYEYGIGFSSSKIIIDLKDGQLSNIPKFRTFDSGYSTDIAYNECFEYTIASGFFGYQVLTDFEFITKPK